MSLKEFGSNANVVGVLLDIDFGCKQVYHLLGTNMPKDLYERLKSVSNSLDSIVIELKNIAENE